MRDENLIVVGRKKRRYSSYKGEIRCHRMDCDNRDSRWRRARP
jgi:hypothetical protein